MGNLNSHLLQIKDFEVWLITGSQHLYGDEVLKNVTKHSVEIASFFDKLSSIPVKVKFKSVVTTPDEITALSREASNSEQCIGLILWMHTFSPAKMWINGLKLLSKPFVHLHTQYNSEIPWNQIDMDFMNENQSAHGDREFGFMVSRMRIPRKVVVGHWKDENTIRRLSIWARVAMGWHSLQRTKVARIGDNMREVAVTEGDKVEAQLQFGVSVHGFGVQDLVRHVDEVSENQIDKLVREYSDLYQISSSLKDSKSIRDAAKIEIGLRGFIEEGRFHAFTDTFENLHGLKQLPGISVQRLMADGYGFGAEGDWKTASLLYAMKVMAQGLEGGTSFMEDYTYHFQNGRSAVLGAHMLEICPSISHEKPTCEVYPLSIGGKEDPARLVFNASSGPAINVSLIDMGNRFRLLVNEVETIEPEHDLPNLPVARALWHPLPDFNVAAQCWILGGGAHHTVYSQSITTEYIEDFAEMAGMELLIIDQNTNTREFKNNLRLNETYYHLFHG
jgi:L-arabinose isomerase